MKKILPLILCCILLTGCTFRQTIQEEGSGTVIPSSVAETLPPEFPVDIYVPDENAVSFNVIHYTVSEIEPSLIVAILIENGVLNQNIRLLNAVLDGSQLNLDFNQTFLDQLCTYGTTGERMMIGSVVNTFLSFYDASTVYITVEGQIMESGHVIYDFPMGFFE